MIIRDSAAAILCEALCSRGYIIVGQYVRSLRQCALKYASLRMHIVDHHRGKSCAVPNEIRASGREVFALMGSLGVV